MPAVYAYSACMSMVVCLPKKNELVFCLYILEYFIGSHLPTVYRISTGGSSA